MIIPSPPSPGPPLRIPAGIIKSLTKVIASAAPGAIINMISNPVNSTVPIAAEVLKAAGKYSPGKVLGVTTLDIVRAKTFYAAKTGADVETVDVPVVGGHAGVTILPLFSQVKADKVVKLSRDDLIALTKRTQDGGTEVVEAKAGKGSATLSMAYAGALFADACLRGLNGLPNVVECTYIASTVVPGLSYFSSKVELGPEGGGRVHGLGNLDDLEKAGLEALHKELAESIQKGIDFAKSG